MTRTRLLAAGAGFAVLTGAIVMLVALVAAPGSWLRGYVSEAGTAGQPFAAAYRWGLVVLSLGVALLGAAFATHPRSARSAPLRSGFAVAVLLGLAALMAGTTSAVPCSAGCPLPPFEPTTVADVVHTAASIVGIGLLALAMLAACVADLRPALRRLSAVAAAITVPIGVALGLTMLLAGRGTLGSSLERILLVVLVGWLIGTSLTTARADPWWTSPAAPGKI